MFGSSSASAGDVNGDGYDDVVVGAYGYDVPGFFFDEGAAFVFLGSPDGVQQTNPQTAHAVLLGDQGAAEFGNSVAGVGDVNGDGFDDIVVTAHFYTTFIQNGTLPVNGAAFLFLGGPSGIVADGPASADAAIYGTQQDGRFGHEVAGLGDVNGDGFDDFAVGAPLRGIPFPPPVASNQGSGDGGAVAIFYGGPAGITATSIEEASHLILPYPPGSPVASQNQLGAGVAGAGDVNGDGYDDVLVGAAGYVAVFQGGPSGVMGTHPDTADTWIQSNASVAIGARVAGAGDVNGDGYDDILAADPGYPSGITNNGTGAFVLFLGGPSGVLASDPSEAATLISGVLRNQFFGWRFDKAGDLDADGFGDVVIGAAEYPGGRRLEGAAYIFSGGPSGLAGTTLDGALVRLAPGQLGASYRGNKQGFDIGLAGDVNGDGVDDLFMGAGLFDAGQTDEGAVFLYHGRSPALGLRGQIGASLPRESTAPR